MKAGPGYTAHHPTYLPWYLPTYPRYIFKNVKIRLAKVLKMLCALAFNFQKVSPRGFLRGFINITTPTTLNTKMRKIDRRHLLFLGLKILSRKSKSVGIFFVTNPYAA